MTGENRGAEFSNISVPRDVTGYELSDDEYDESDQAILAAAIQVWRANIAQYMSKLEVEMISAHISQEKSGEKKSRGSWCSIPRSDREAFFVALRYGKTLQKTLVASHRTTDPVRPASWLREISLSSQFFNLPG
jgi:hypothetical protein